MNPNSSDKAGGTRCLTSVHQQRPASTECVRCSHLHDKDQDRPELSSATTPQSDS